MRGRERERERKRDEYERGRQRFSVIKRKKSFRDRALKLQLCLYC
jgi:hypothetical protein